MPEQHRAFYAGLESIFVCVLDGGGRPRAMALTGRAGFIHSPTPAELTITSQQVYDPGTWPGRQISCIKPKAPFYQAACYFRNITELPNACAKPLSHVFTVILCLKSCRKRTMWHLDGTRMW